MSLLNSDSNINHEAGYSESPEPPRGSKGKGIFLGIVITALALCNVYLVSRVDTLQGETRNLQATLTQQIGGVEEMSSLHVGQAQRELEAMRERMEEARKEAAGRAQREARRHADQVAKNVSQQQQRQQEEFMTGIHDVRTVADEANTEVKVVRSDLMGVKADVEETDAQLYETASLLEETNEGLSELNGQITDNRSEIVALRQWTERDRIHFELAKSKDMQRVGDIQIRLRNTHVKQSKFTIEILADDKKFVKKGRHVAEPVVFYMGDTAQPYELVITGIAKNSVKGYLARPKLELASR